VEERPAKELPSEEPAAPARERVRPVEVDRWSLLLASPLVLSTLVTALLLALRDRPLPQTLLAAETPRGPQLVLEPTPAVWVAFVVMAVAMTYLLGGLMHTGRIVRVIGLILGSC
jgi:hypothetical protein